jgi:hypothetical protein
MLATSCAPVRLSCASGTAPDRPLPPRRSRGLSAFTVSRRGRSGCPTRAPAYRHPGLELDRRRFGTCSRGTEPSRVGHHDLSRGPAAQRSRPQRAQPHPTDVHTRGCSRSERTERRAAQPARHFAPISQRDAGEWGGLERGISSPHRSDGLGRAGCESGRVGQDATGTNNPGCHQRNRRTMSHRSTPRS